MSKTPDMNIKNWSIEDIQQLFEVDKLDPIQITKVADRLIDKSISDFITVFKFLRLSTVSGRCKVRKK